MENSSTTVLACCCLLECSSGLFHVTMFLNNCMKSTFDFIINSHLFKMKKTCSNSKQFTLLTVVDSNIKRAILPEGIASQWFSRLAKIGWVWAYWDFLKVWFWVQVKQWNPWWFFMDWPFIAFFPKSNHLSSYFISKVNEWMPWISEIIK